MKEVKVNALEELAMDEMMAVDGGGVGSIIGGVISKAYSKPVKYPKHDKSGAFTVTRPASKTMVRIGNAISKYC